MKRVLELDGIRGLLCLGVVFYHVHHDWIFWWWSTMDFFFVYSGFVISAQLILNRDADNLLGTFFKRRALRVWPVYFLTLAVGLAVYLATRHASVWGALRERTWLQVATATAFVEGYVRPLSIPPYPFHLIHTWSVSIEEQFYVLLALSFVALRRFAWSVPAIAAAFITAGLWWRGSEGGHLYLLLNHADAFGCGLLLSQLFCSGAADRHRRILVPVFASCMLVSVPMWAGHLWQGYSLLVSGQDLSQLSTPAVVNVGFILLWVGLIGAAALTSGHPLWAPVRSRFATYFGDVTYPLYLTHYMTIVLAVVAARRLGYDDELLPAALGAIAGIVGAHLIHVWVEKPLTRFKAGMKYRVPGRPPRKELGVGEAVSVKT